MVTNPRELWEVCELLRRISRPIIGVALGALRFFEGKHVSRADVVELFGGTVLLA